MSIPSIIIYNLGSHDSKLINEILYGIEEEGIPYIIENRNEDEFKSIDEASYKASLSSQLSVGIALNREYIVMHYANLKEGNPLFKYSLKETTLNNIRNFGANAARMVKGIYFILKN